MDPNRTEAREGRYANHLEVGHDAEELVMDFGQVFDHDPPLLHTRIVTHPTFAREMVEVLHESLSLHEKIHGGRKSSKRSRPKR